MSFEKAAVSSCSPTVSADLTVKVPFIYFGGGHLSATLKYSNFDGCSYWFTVTDAALLTDISGFSGCGPAVITDDLILHMSNAVMGGNIISADFQYVPTGTAAIDFKLMNFASSSVISTGDYTLSAGETLDLADNLEIRASGNVDIAGTISPSVHYGQSIVIIADGNITISGSLTAGDGMGGGNAGSVKLISNHGNVTITDTAQIRAGDGGAGAACSSTTNFVTSSGGNGGSVILRAPSGTITAAAKTGLFHIGNGGNSGDVQIQGETLLATPLPATGAMRPGDSGVFEMTAITINSIPYQTVVLERDLVDPSTGLPIYKQGDTVNMPSSIDQFTGGEGGDAGAIYYGMDADGNSTWPDQLPMKELSVTVKSGISGLNSQYKEQYPTLEVYGENGAYGYIRGGNGGDIRVKGRDGAVPGQSGQDVRATAGTGGPPQVQTLGREFGRGGDAIAMGGNGASGFDPDSPGGDGGKAEALAGLSNKDELIGEAIATGGNGGRGGGHCPYNVSYIGGVGGSGGEAVAWAKETYYLVMGKATAKGGDGGNGGDATVVAGNGGLSGLATVIGNGLSQAFDGLRGNAGSTCLPSPPSTNDIPGIYSLIGTKTANDTCGTKTEEHISNPSVPISADGNVITVYSTADISGQYNGTTGQFNGTGTTNDDMISETINGSFLLDDEIVLKGTLRFDFLAPSLNCFSEYDVEYRRIGPYDWALKRFMQ